MRQLAKPDLTAESEAQPTQAEVQSVAKASKEKKSKIGNRKKNLTTDHLKREKKG